MPKAKNVKKKFIDRKKAVTFSLVHRSQRDPLVADEGAPQRVLVPVSAVVPTTSSSNKQPELTTEQRREVQQKYGIYYDDDYNYLQHLKDSREVTLLVTPKPVHKRKEKSGGGGPDSVADEERLVQRTLQLPSSVFASTVEEEVGLLNKAAPQGLCLSLDPEVVAALDDDFDYEDPDNQLEDDFIQLAAGDGGDYDSDDSDSDASASEAGSQRAFASDSDDDGGGHSDDSQRGRGGGGGGVRMRTWEQDEETRSRFSHYSMSSSVVRRSEGLSLLDQRFEKMFAEYDDTELGAVECEEIEGPMPDRAAADLLEQAGVGGGGGGGGLRLGAGERDRIHRLHEIAEEGPSDGEDGEEEEGEEEEGEEEELVRVRVRGAPVWDCESILTTYSTLYNHPKLIHEPRKADKIKLHAKTGVPVDVLGHTARLTAKCLARFDAQHPPPPPPPHPHAGGAGGGTRADTVLSTLSVLSIRPQDESVEEKKDRKRLLKEYRKERRVEKKANKDAFREEKKRQEKISLNNRNNVQGNRIL